MMERIDTTSYFPLVTIVTPVLNLITNKRISLFKKCLSSVQKQSYANIEHIVIDGASSDNTAKVLEYYKQKGWIQYISQKDTCVYEAMNTGIHETRGKYIAILNSDDFFHNSQAVELSVAALGKSNADFSYADCDVVCEGKFQITFKAQLERFITRMPFSHQTMFIKRSTLQQFGFFDLKYPMAADYNLIIKLLLAGCTSIYVPHSITTYNLGGLSDKFSHLSKEDCAKIYKEQYAPFYTFSSHEEAYYLFEGQKIPKAFIKNFYKWAKKRHFTNFDWQWAVEDMALMSHSKKLRARARISRNFRYNGFLGVAYMEGGRFLQRIGFSLKKYGITLEEKVDKVYPMHKN